jgi:hypothetical protein
MRGSINSEPCSLGSLSPRKTDFLLSNERAVLSAHVATRCKGVQMKRIICSLLVVTFVAVVSAQENPLAKSSGGDWAKYLVTTKNETVPLMSGTDKPRWWAVSGVSDGFVRIDSYMMFGGSRVGAGGNMFSLKDRFEPVPGLGKSAKVQVTSTSKERLTINGKGYDCTKIVRTIDQPLDESIVQASWSGTSTLWICDELPLGLAKMENAYQTQMSKSDKGQKLIETWVIAEFGFKNWK